MAISIILMDLFLKKKCQVRLFHGSISQTLMSIFGSHFKDGISITFNGCHVHRYDGSLSQTTMSIWWISCFKRYCLLVSWIPFLNYDGIYFDGCHVHVHHFDGQPFQTAVFIVFMDNHFQNCYVHCVDKHPSLPSCFFFCYFLHGMRFSVILRFFFVLWQSLINIQYKCRRLPITATNLI